MGWISTHCTSIIIIQTIIVQMSPSHAQSSLTQYLQLAGLGPHITSSSPASSGPPLSYSSPNYAASSSYQSPAYSNSPSASRSSAPQSNSLPLPLSTLASLAASIPVSKTPSQKAPVVPKPSKNLQSGGLDSNVLNNLAIALQLLIVSNILNMPAVETTEPISKFELSTFESLPTYDSMTISPLTLSHPAAHSPVSVLPPSISFIESPRTQSVYLIESQSIPNANFLGSSGFAEPPIFRSVVPTKPNPRTNMALMSPYEALGPNSPFADPVLSSVYSSSYTKKDFQSPYASILAADGIRDLFSVAEIF